MSKPVPNKQTILKELARREKIREEQALRPKFRIDEFCFDKQVSFINDIAKFKTAVCSRRAGKTVSCAADLVDTCLMFPDVNVAYITLNRRSAKRIIWKDLLRICDKFKLEPKIDNTELTISFQNGSVIYVSGATDESDIEKFRGLSLKKVYIDEAQSFRSFIKTLVDDILVPALFDYDGSLCLIGTPGPVCAGYFYESCTGSGWSHHHWTLFDNPWIQKKSGKTVEQILAAERARRGITEQDPTYRRESLGQWVPDSDALAFRFSADRNGYQDLPNNEMIYIMGVDIGWSDADAIAILAYNFTDKNVYLVEEHVKSKQTISELVSEIKFFKEKYKPVRMVMDAGALGKKIQEEILQRHQLYIEAAEKHRKMEFIELLNDDLRTGRFKAKSSSKFAEDCFLVQKDMSNPQKPKISDIYHTDIGDAVLYGWRECKHYLAEKAPNTPAPNTDAFMQAAEEAEAEQMEEKKKRTSMDDLFGSQEDMDSLTDGITDIYGDDF